jgi:lysophospholipase L1-like esterase
VCALVLGSDGRAQAPEPAKQKPPSSPSFREVDDVPGLPRVLLIGDSISMGYTLAVREALAGKANVHRPADNCGPTIKGLQKIDAWLGEGRWDLIHFNFGIHDTRLDSAGRQQVPLDQYEKNLRALVARLKQTGATLIWSATTPVPENCKPPRTNSDVIAYNAAARKIMESSGIAIDDLYSFAVPRLSEIQLPTNVHFNQAGSKILAQQVASTIAEVLHDRGEAGEPRILPRVVQERKTGAVEAAAAGQAKLLETGLEFIDTGFENASPLWYEAAADGAILVHLLYDHERSSPNRAAGHFHFRLVARTGAALRLEFRNLDNVYNGRPGSVANELKVAVVSQDGRVWKPVPVERLAGDRVRLDVTMPGPELYVARAEPYRLSDLERWLSAIGQSPLVAITPIGATVEARGLEIVRVGRPDAPYRVFLRARAHAWEPGGNWVVHGLVGRLLQGDDEARSYLERYCVYVLPMANKDGVARGRTRFNLRGKDLNRNWDKPADPQLAPENAALEAWLEAMICQGQRPHLALELHNDGNGLLHVSRPPVAGLERYLDRMKTLEALLHKHTWFTEGSTNETYRNAGTLGEGWLERYGIDAAVHELNVNWIAGLKDYPSGAHWSRYGEQLARVFFEYFDAVRP